MGQLTVGSNPTSSARSGATRARPASAGCPSFSSVSDAVASTSGASVDDVGWMRLALGEAVKATRHGDVPVGALAVAGGHVVASRHNERELQGDPTAHAEVLVLRDAAAELGTWRLEGVVVVVTLEPCAMCAGALVAARVSRLVFGAFDPKAGACGSLYNLCADPRLNHEVPVSGGVLAEECGTPLTAFFASRRDRA